MLSGDDILRAGRCKAVEAVQTAIGELFICEISGKDENSLSQKLGKAIKDTESKIYVKELISFVCHRLDKLIEDKFKPSDPTLTDDEVAKLTEDDLETFAKLYLKHNEYLFKKREEKVTKNDKGQRVVKFELGKIEHPQKEEESNIEYIHRLAMIREEKKKKQIKAVLGQADSIKTFSTGLQHDIRRMMGYGNELKDILKTTNIISSFKDMQPVYESPEQLDFPLKTTGEVTNENINRLIVISEKTADLIVESTSVQTKIASELKTSSDATKWYSKINIGLTLIIIVITFFGIYLTDKINKESQKSSAAEVLAIKYNFDEMNNTIVNLTKTISQTTVAQVKVSENMTEQLANIMSSANTILREMLVGQDLLINELKQLNSREQQTIEELQKRINELEEKANKDI